MMNKVLKKVCDFFYTIVFAFIFAFVFQTLFFQPFKIPSGSMKPNLVVGDYLFVKKFAYGYNNSSLAFGLNKIRFFDKSLNFAKPDRGDIIVFLSKRKNSPHYIKRLIGLPGDTVQIIQGELYINGNVVKRRYKNRITDENNQNLYIYKEFLPNGISYDIYKSHYDTLSFPNQTPVYKVPQGYYFFMGDNRDNSIDSRYLEEIGYIPFTNVLGKATILFWNSDFSFSRLFKFIK